jgi:hypothetical protein
MSDVKERARAALVDNRNVDPGRARVLVDELDAAGLLRDEAEKELAEAVLASEDVSLLPGYNNSGHGWTRINKAAVALRAARKPKERWTWGWHATTVVGACTEGDASKTITRFCVPTEAQARAVAAALNQLEAK